MKKNSLCASGFELSTKQEFLDEMNLVMPWAELGGLIRPHASAGNTGRLPFAVQTLLHIHFMPRWFILSDPAMEEALYGTPLYCVIQANALLHGQETLGHGDAGIGHVAMRPGKRRMQDKTNGIDAPIEKLKARAFARMEYSFRVVKRKFGYVDVRYSGLAKNTAQLHTLFALSNLWMVRERILQGCAGMSASAARPDTRNMPARGSPCGEAAKQTTSTRSQFHLVRNWLRAAIEALVVQTIPKSECGAKRESMFSMIEKN